MGDDLKKASQLAKKSTASLGKFQDKLPSALEKKVKTPQGKKRKFDPLVNKDEKAKSLKVLEQLNSKKSKIDLTKAVGRKIYDDENEQSEEKKKKKGASDKRGTKGQGGKKRNRGTFTSGKKGGKPGGKTGILPGGRSGGKPGGSGKAGGKKGGKA